jgi:hypothetical protein
MITIVIYMYMNEYKWLAGYKMINGICLCGQTSIFIIPPISNSGN